MTRHAHRFRFVRRMAKALWETGCSWHPHQADRCVSSCRLRPGSLAMAPQRCHQHCHQCRHQCRQHRHQCQQRQRYHLHGAYHQLRLYLLLHPLRGESPRRKKHARHCRGSWSRYRTLRLKLLELFWSRQPSRRNRTQSRQRRSFLRLGRWPVRRQEHLLSGSRKLSSLLHRTRPLQRRALTRSWGRSPFAHPRADSKATRPDLPHASEALPQGRMRTQVSSEKRRNKRPLLRCRNGS